MGEDIPTLLKTVQSQTLLQTSPDLTLTTTFGVSTWETRSLEENVIALQQAIISSKPAKVECKSFVF